MNLHKVVHNVKEQLKEIQKDPTSILTSNPYARPFEIYEPLVTAVVVTLKTMDIKEVSMFSGLTENLSNNAEYAHIVSAIRENGIAIVKE